MEPMDPASVRVDKVSEVSSSRGPGTLLDSACRKVWGALMQRAN
jgi:hypothetical protein